MEVNISVPENMLSPAQHEKNLRHSHVHCTHLGGCEGKVNMLGEMSYEHVLGDTEKMSCHQCHANKCCEYEPEHIPLDVSDLQSRVGVFGLDV